MTIQKVKNYLSQVYYIDKRVELLQDELLLLESKLEKCTASYTYTKGGGTQPSFVYVLDKVIQYRNRLNCEIANLIDKKKEIKKTIERIENPKMKLILFQKYINFYTFEWIAVKLDMEQRQIRRLHKKALEDLCNIL